MLENDELELEAEDSDKLDEAIEDAVAAIESAARGRLDAEEESSEPAEVEALREELADLRDRSTRTLADFDNYRKRVTRERQDERRYASFDLVREVLNVVDNLERALAAGGSVEDLKTGVEMISRQLVELLSRQGVEKVEALGQPFDPNLHEAVAQNEDRGVSEPTVKQEMQPGYRLYDRLLRPAVVVVSMPAADAKGEGSTEHPGEDPSTWN